MSNEHHPSVTAYRIDKHTQDVLTQAVADRNFDLFNNSLTPVQSNFKSTSLLKKILANLGKREKTEWGKKLVTMDQITKKVCGGILLKQAKAWKRDPRLIYEIVNKFCQDDNWNVRQVAVDLLEEMYAKGQENAINYLHELISSENVYHRRLALLTSKQIAQSAYYSRELKLQTLELIWPLISEKDPYVVTITKETFEEGFMKYCPNLVFDWVSDNLDQITDPTAISTVLMMVGSRYVKEYIDQSLAILEKYLPYKNPKIKTARSSALHSLAGVDHDYVANFLESRLHIQEAVDHWAELQALGSLDAFNI